MKKKLAILTTMFALFVSSVSYSQDDITEFLEFGQHNASQLVRSYVDPLGHSLGNNMNSGWYNTGQAHRLGRFDFRFGIPVTFVSEDRRTFVFDPNDYEGLSLVDPSDNKAPTIFGSKGDGPLVEYEGAEINLPPGTGIGYFPIIPPTLQLNVGLIRETEIMIRYVPTVSVRDFSTGMYGFGVKHGIKQYIPFIKHIPFDLSIIGSYGNMSVAYGLEYDPLNNPDIDIDEQELDISATAYSVNLVASKKLPFITFYGGLRYMYSDTRFVMAGDYDVGTEVITDPVDFNMTSSQFGLNAGTRVKLGFLSLFVDGTWSKYSSITGGISLGFHN